AASSYESWFSTRRQGTDRSWFRDAVQARGYDATGLAGYATGQRDLRAVPVLLKTIRDDDPVIRRNSDLALRRVTGMTPPAKITRATTREEAKSIADRWSA